MSTPELRNHLTAVEKRIINEDDIIVCEACLCYADGLCASRAPEPPARVPRRAAA
jgi:hypothetical protein